MTAARSERRYIERGGELVARPPYLASGVDFYGFSVTGDRAALQTSVCDRFLNGPLGRPGRFVPVTRHVLFVFNRIGSLSSTVDPDFGTSSELEAAVWVLVADTKRLELSWFHPYMLVDGDTALASGREVYGFPKGLGWMTVPPGGAPPASLAVETMVTDVPGGRRTRQPLFNIRKVESGAHTLLDDLTGLTEHLWSRLGILNEIASEASALGSWANVHLDLPHLKVPFVFLKQFRDGTDGGIAALQTIQRAKPEASKVIGAHLFHSRFTLDIRDAASHPIRRDLGLPAGTIPVDHAFWTGFDFKIGACEILDPDE